MSHFKKPYFSTNIININTISIIFNINAVNACLKFTNNVLFTYPKMLNCTNVYNPLGGKRN